MDNLRKQLVLFQLLVLEKTRFILQNRGIKHKVCDIYVYINDNGFIDYAFNFDKIMSKSWVKWDIQNTDVPYGIETLNKNGLLNPNTSEDESQKIADFFIKLYEKEKALNSKKEKEKSLNSDDEEDKMFFILLFLIVSCLVYNF